MMHERDIPAEADWVVLEVTVPRRARLVAETNATAFFDQGVDTGVRQACPVFGLGGTGLVGFWPMRPDRVDPHPVLATLEDMEASAGGMGPLPQDGVVARAIASRIRNHVTHDVEAAPGEPIPLFFGLPRAQRDAGVTASFALEARAVQDDGSWEPSAFQYVLADSGRFDCGSSLAAFESGQWLATPWLTRGELLEKSHELSRGAIVWLRVGGSLGHSAAIEAPEGTVAWRGRQEAGGSPWTDPAMVCSPEGGEWTVRVDWVAGAGHRSVVAEQVALDLPTRWHPAFACGA